MYTSLQSLCLRVSAAAVTFMIAPPAWAQLFGPTPAIGGVSDVRQKIIDVVFIVIAGIRLVISQGEEAEKDKAKKTILFVIIGLVVILLAQGLVDFIATQLAA
ncbi:MAG: hypothetical protein UY87_C0028G0003 [Candidatus Peribacteria bacterium GW2011_GWC2_54_8]|nr:MAG: hypothetical protein UY87_C0028G0003 [Candidatus Peribacteria bacterium GW2011_GWC2_54_8]